MLLRGVLIYLRSSLRYFRVSLKWVTQLSKTIISLCSQKLSGIQLVCNFLGWAGMISIYIIRVDKKCDVFFQKQNGESNTDPAIILRRLHNLSAKQARWLIPEKIDIRQHILILDFFSVQKAFFPSPFHLKLLEVTLKWCSLVHICGKLSPKLTLSLFSPPLLI